MNWTAKTIEQVNVADIKPYSGNARTHSEHQIELLAKAIREFGFTTPLLMKSDRTLVAGHGRLEAARLVGLQTVPAIFVDHLSDRQLKALVLSDNKIATLAGWDYDQLSREINELVEMEMDLEVTGFNEQELDELLKGVDQLLPGDPFASAAYNEPRDGSSLTGNIPTVDHSVALVPVGESVRTSGKIEMIEFREYKIPMSEEEASQLHERLKDHIEHNGSIVGFISHLLSL